MTNTTTVTKKVKFSDIIYIPALNSRHVDPESESIKRLSRDIAEYGLFQDLLVAPHLVDDGDGGHQQKWRIVDGARRYSALRYLEQTNEAAFKREVPDGKMTIKVYEGTQDELHERSVRMNTQREQMEPWEYQYEVVRRHNLGQDQYEIAEALNIQQPRVNEFLSFQKLLPEIVDAWKNHLLHHHDLVKFAAMEPEDQETAFREFSVTVQASGGKKAEARKALKKAAKEKGNVREYANAGKPTRQKLASYVPQIAVRAIHAKTAAERAFNNALAAAFKVFNGELDFEKISHEKDYVTQKEALAAQKEIAATEKKAAEKAEKAAAKEAAKAPKSLKKGKGPKAETATKPAKAAKPKKDKGPKAPKAPKAAKADKPKKTKPSKPAKASKAKKGAPAPALAAE